MIRHTVAFRAVDARTAAAGHRMIALYSEAEENRDHLEATLGAPFAQRVLDMMAQGFIRGSYKEFNLLPGETDGHFVLFLGLGSKKDNLRRHRRNDRLRGLVAIAARHFRRKGITRFAVDDFSSMGVKPDRAGALIAEGVVLGTYQFDLYTTRQKSARTEEITVRCRGDVATIQAALDRGRTVAEAVCMSRDLINMPSSDLRPMDFAERVRAVADEFDTLECDILGRDAMTAERFGLHLAVARGSNAEPAVCVLRYVPAGQSKDGPWPLALVGKGVTFDTGGYDIKPASGMRRMYRDMAGAGAVLGAMRAIAALGLPIKVVAVMPCSENMINGEAFRPGDILKSRKGLTVEIADTDAEGRLLLADSLTYVCDNYQPETLCDIATLTGAVRVALGLFVTGLITHSDDEELDEWTARTFREAGHRVGEWVWRLPVDDDYKVQLGSKVADLANCNLDGITGAGTITAAVFLKQFIDFGHVKRWAHLDIAATAFMERTAIYNKSPYMPKEGATAIGVRLLTEVADRIAQERAGQGEAGR
ncbi:MAG: leucyl aminopeptidase family protein [Myxococcales bacterium]|nr:leucyl aminopeptidase family protein [Myxococcales bacterium]